jgi:hypothetical protein
MKDKEQRTRDGGREDGKQRSKGQEQWNRATKKGTLGQLIDRVQITGTRSRVVTQGIEDGIQGTET